MTIADFLAQHPTKFSVEQTDFNPHMDDSRGMDHWLCRMQYQKRRFQVVFSKGSGHLGKEPTIEEVLDCIVSDASSYDNAGSFEDWASEYGFDPDSRKLEKTYKAIGNQADRLKHLFGPAYNTLLECERG